MQYKKEEVNNRIISAATNAFQKYGYRQTSMMQVSLDSRVPIGNLYRYFPSKEFLFEEVVGNACKRCFELIDEIYEVSVDKLKNSSEKFIASTGDIADMLIEYINEYSTQMFILLRNSQGSKYESFRENVIDRVSELIRKGFFGVQAMNEPLMSEIMTKSLMEGFISIASMIPKDQQKKQMEKLMNFFFYKIEERMS